MIRLFSGALLGLEGEIVEIEVDVSKGLKQFLIVGLGDKAIEESKERINVALKNLKFLPPFKKAQKVFVNLAPANLKKEGSFYDLAIALGYLLETAQIKFNPSGKFFIGELSFDGNLKGIKGALPLAILASKCGFKEIILPKENFLEASLISLEKKIKVVGFENLLEVISYLEGKIKFSPPLVNFSKIFKKRKEEIKISWIKGQERAKRALLISAAGGHHLLMVGPPGVGKTLLAKSICSILPELNLKEILELTKIYSISGLLSLKNPFVKERPFRNPHHSASKVALIGGGNPPLPGEITLAHKGILFLDELPEFHRDVLEALRQPIEDGKITISRAKYSLSFPCEFTLIAASNPCPCGNLDNPKNICTCSQAQISSYRRKLKGPLIDRIDLFLEIPPVEFEKLILKPEKEKIEEELKKKVKRAREIQIERGGKLNFQMNISEIEKTVNLDRESNEILKKYVERGKLSARGFHKVLKVARTIADLKEKEKTSFEDIAEALAFRIKEDQ